MLLRPTCLFACFFLLLFVKVSNSGRISSATHVAECLRAVLELSSVPGLFPTTFFPGSSQSLYDT